MTFSYLLDIKPVPPRCFRERERILDAIPERERSERTTLPKKVRRAERLAQRAGVATADGRIGDRSSDLAVLAAV
jgi:hypothetical protein